LAWTIARQSLLAEMRGISKSHLDAFRLEDGAAQRFENPAAGFRAFAKWLGKAPVARVVFEPTIAPSRAFSMPCQAMGHSRPRRRAPDGSMAVS